MWTAFCGTTCPLSWCRTVRWVWHRPRLCLCRYPWEGRTQSYRQLLFVYSHWRRSRVFGLATVLLDRRTARCFRRSQGKAWQDFNGRLILDVEEHTQTWPQQLQSLGVNTPRHASGRVICTAWAPSTQYSLTDPSSWQECAVLMELWSIHFWYKYKFDAWSRRAPSNLVTRLGFWKSLRSKN